MSSNIRGSVRVLQECIDVQNKKAQDYQNPASTVKQADYYLNGVQTIYDTMHGKMLRIRSIQETMKNDPNFKANHESLRDSVVDLINYASFYAAYLDGLIPGQEPNRDMFNRPFHPFTDLPITTARQSINNDEDAIYKARREIHP